MTRARMEHPGAGGLLLLQKGGRSMRMILTGLIFALVLGMSGAGAIVVAGDVGPGRNGSLPATLLHAGDIGPGRNG